MERTARRYRRWTDSAKAHDLNATVREALRRLDPVDESLNVPEAFDLNLAARQRALAMARHPASIAKRLREELGT